MNEGPLMLLYEFWGILVDGTTLLYNFLFQDITVIGITFKPFYVIGTAGLITLIIAKVIKEFVPVA